MSENDDDQNDDNADNEGDNDQDDDNEQTESNNDDDDFVHPKLSTFDEKERQDEEDNKEDWSDNEAYDEETQGGNDEKERMDEEETNEEEEANELYRDVNVNLEGRDTTMLELISSTAEFFCIIRLHFQHAQPNRNTVLAPIFILNTESTSLVDVPKTLYKALVNAYETDKDILETYGDTVTFKRHQDDEDEDEEPSAGSNRGSKRRRVGKEPESTSAPKEKTSVSSGKSKEGSKSHQKSTGKIYKDQPVDETTQHPDWFQKTNKTRTPTVIGTGFDLLNHGQETLDKHFSSECKISSLQSILLIQLDWIQPKDSNIYIDLQRAFTIDSIYETKVADYGHIKWIEDFVPNSMWSQVLSVHDKHALWGISHWGRKRQQFYRFAVNRESARDVYSKHRILAVTKLKIIEWHNYKHLDWIGVHRNDDKLYTFKEGDYNRLRLLDIEVMLLLLVQGKLKNLNVVERLGLGVSLQMFTRSIILRRGVEDLQILDGVTLLRQSGRIVDRTEQEAYDPGYYIDKTPEQKVIEEPGKFVVGVIRGRPSIL
ncbi:hypothetical protein Tco_1402295 [Tanacetum coccineum]